MYAVCIAHLLSHKAPTDFKFPNSVGIEPVTPLSSADIDCQRFQYKTKFQITYLDDWKQASCTNSIVLPNTTYFHLSSFPSSVGIVPVVFLFFLFLLLFPLFPLFPLSVLLPSISSLLGWSERSDDGCKDGTPDGYTDGIDDGHQLGIVDGFIASSFALFPSILSLSSIKVLPSISSSSLSNFRKVYPPTMTNKILHFYSVHYSLQNSSPLMNIENKHLRKSRCFSETKLPNSLGISPLIRFPAFHDEI